MEGAEQRRKPEEWREEYGRRGLEARRLACERRKMMPPLTRDKVTEVGGHVETGVQNAAPTGDKVQRCNGRIFQTSTDLVRRRNLDGRLPATSAGGSRYEHGFDLEATETEEVGVEAQRGGGRARLTTRSTDHCSRTALRERNGKYTGRADEVGRYSRAGSGSSG